MKKLKKRNGFTYMEMIVTMLVIIALSLISYPLYTGRQNSTKPAIAEGYALLGYIVNAQIAYFNEYGHFMEMSAVPYANWRGDYAYTCNDIVLGINAINNRYFTWFNPFGNQTTRNVGPYKYHFTAVVKSKDYGTISLEYNLTQRFDPIVEGV